MPVGTNAIKLIGVLLLHLEAKIAHVPFVLCPYRESDLISEDGSNVNYLIVHAPACWEIRIFPLSSRWCSFQNVLLKSLSLSNEPTMQFNSFGEQRKENLIAVKLIVGGYGAGRKQVKDRTDCYKPFNRYKSNCALWQRFGRSRSVLINLCTLSSAQRRFIHSCVLF